MYAKNKSESKQSNKDLKAGRHDSCISEAGYGYEYIEDDPKHNNIR